MAGFQREDSAFKNESTQAAVWVGSAPAVDLGRAMTSRVHLPFMQISPAWFWRSTLTMTEPAPMRGSGLASTTFSSAWTTSPMKTGLMNFHSLTSRKAMTVPSRIPVCQRRPEAMDNPNRPWAIRCPNGPVRLNSASVWMRLSSPLRAAKRHNIGVGDRARQGGNLFAELEFFKIVARRSSPNCSSAEGLNEADYTL